jgi:4-amino-4-deoxy-L-arabinose transferase-like glycosyltransferase
MRYDEATTYDNYVSKPLYIGLANYSTPNNHLLHTFLAKLSVTAFGSAPWAIRLPALLAGIAILPATFALARVHYGKVAALLATALVATSSTLVEYSTNARGYTLVVLLTLVALLAGARVIQHGSASAWAVIAIACGLGLFAVPIMVYAVGGVFLWLVLTFVVERRSAAVWIRPLVATGLAIAVLTALLYAPVFAASGVRSVTSNEFVQARSFGAMLGELPDHGRAVFAAWHRDLPLVVTTALAVGALASLAFTRRLSRFAVPPLLPFALVGILAIAAQRVVPYPRVWLFLLPLILVTAVGLYGRLLEQLRRSTAVAAAAAAAVAAAGVAAVVSADSVRTSRETGGLLDAAPVAALLAREVEPGDRVFAPGSDVILEYYLEREGIDGGPLLYEQDCRPRTFVVVNLLGGQTLSTVLPQLTTAGDLGRPVLVRRYPSAAVYSVERTCGAVARSA